ncbi:MAG TPA: hypothetical protein VGK34_06740 [Armatimonadota bacterium]|jgi:exopolyphosphatase/guanosine-5'-triphosphate,3'-diphosphate pyrophosphatase
MIAAAIDVGTNSIKSCIGERDAGGSIRVLKEMSAIARLGEGFDAAHKLQTAAIDRAVKAIGKQVQVARDLGADRIRLVGTSAVRDATNRDVLIDQVEREFGVKLETASEYDEARLSYSAVALDPVLGGYSGHQLVVDIGGGSTEFIYGEDSHMGFTMSVRAGAVRLTEKFLNGEKQTADQIVDAGIGAENLIRDVARKAKVDRLVGVGGSIINMARIQQGVTPEKTDRVHGLRMSHRDIGNVMNLLVLHTVEERRRIVGLEPERADTILGGAVILDRILALCEIEEIIVSIRGLRHGLLNEMLSS